MSINQIHQPETNNMELETKEWKTRRKGEISIFDPKIIRRAIPDSFKKLDPRVQLKNPVMFVVEVGSAITTIEFVRLLFTHFAEAMAEGRGKAQADTLRKARSTTMARRLASSSRASAIAEVAAPE